MTFSNEDKFRCADREVKMRSKVYPGLIRRGKLTYDEANKETDLMREIATDYYRAMLKDQKK